MTLFRRFSLSLKVLTFAFALIHTDLGVASADDAQADGTRLSSTNAANAGKANAGKAGSIKPQPASLLLITLDTTRADAIGAYGNPAATTPTLDQLAARGKRYARAISPAPITLPAHASLLTGLEPPEHGVRDNGISSLPDDVPTLATRLSRRGYSTSAIVASAVLDQRFGLGRGFDAYDDHMAAERTGEYGYPERDAHAVVTAALSRLGAIDNAAPAFMWVHFYDPHAPYQPRSVAPNASVAIRYAAEVTFVDQQIDRLLNAWSAQFPSSVVAVVGDHGESLGEHGERTHGLFLYRSGLETPLIIVGPGIQPGVVDEAVSTRRIAPTLLWLLGERDLSSFGHPLPGIGPKSPPQTIFSETWLPATAYGWSPIAALSDQRRRFIAAPDPELYDIDADPGELNNLMADISSNRENRAAVKRLSSTLKAYQKSMVDRVGEKPLLDPALAENLRSLGYLSGSSGSKPRIGSGMDPKEGLKLLHELELAEQEARSGRHAASLARLEKLVARNPKNVPFTSRLAGALLSAGQTQKAIETYRRAVELNPTLDFSHLHLAQAYRQVGRLADARDEYRMVLELNPRFAAAWLGLAEMAGQSGKSGEERKLLEEAVAAKTSSAGILLRLGQLVAADGEPLKATQHVKQATELTPGWDLPWFVLGQLHASQGEAGEARTALGQVLQLSPGSRLAQQAALMLKRLPPS